MAEKLVFLMTHGPDHEEHATIPFVMAVAALSSDVEAVIGLQADAVSLAKKGTAETVVATGFPPLTKLIGDFRELGGKLLVCTPCLKCRGIEPEQLIEGVELVAAGRFVVEVTSATNVLTY